MTFSQWMKRVDCEIMSISGLCSGDLADRPYYDQFEDEISPYDAAIECLEYNDYPVELL